MLTLYQAHLLDQGSQFHQGAQEYRTDLHYPFHPMFQGNQICRPSPLVLVVPAFQVHLKSQNLQVSLSQILGDLAILASHWDQVVLGILCLL